ncbi:MAG: hypothetical protein AB2A00_14525 [Myxococcota bacterium]
MAAKTNPAVAKRQKELTRQKRQQEKAAERAERRQERATRQGADEGEDPDIAGIVPGPQPRRDD